MIAVRSSLTVIQGEAVSAERGKCQARLQHDLLNVSGVMNASGDTLQLPKEQRFKRRVALGWLQFLLTENSCSASAEGLDSDTFTTELWPANLMSRSSLIPVRASGQRWISSMINSVSAGRRW
jgi:hypothetical protein